MNGMALKKICNGKILRLVSKMLYFIKPPGWSHDGSRLTSRQMQKQEEGKIAEVTASLQITEPKPNILKTSQLAAETA